MVLGQLFGAAGRRAGCQLQAPVFRDFSAGPRSCAKGLSRYASCNTSKARGAPVRRGEHSLDARHFPGSPLSLRADGPPVRPLSGFIRDQTALRKSPFADTRPVREPTRHRCADVDAERRIPATLAPRSGREATAAAAEGAAPRPAGDAAGRRVPRAEIRPSRRAAGREPRRVSRRPGAEAWTGARR